MNIAIVGCGHIAIRVAQGIIYSEGNLYAVAARDKERARQFSLNYPDCKYMDYDEVFADENVDMVYIATVNTAHYGLIKRALLSHKHVICEKPMLANEEEINEVFELARSQGCFLMEAHKTCFTVLNRYLRPLINEKIGRIEHIYGQYCSLADFNSLKDFNTMEKTMGGCRFDIGVYPICFANYYAGSAIRNVESVKIEKGEYPNDIDMTAELLYENGITATVRSSWLDGSVNKGIIYGEKRRVEIVNFWKNTEAEIILNDGSSEKIKVEQASDFTGEVNEAVRCAEKGMCESEVMSEKASLEIMKVLRKVKES